MADQTFPEGREKDDVARPGPDKRVIVREVEDGRYRAVTELHRTKDGRLVTAAHPDRDSLFARRNDLVFEEELIFFGIVEGD